MLECWQTHGSPLAAAALLLTLVCRLQVDLTINLVERKTGGLGAGTGISAAGRAAGNMPGFVGNFTYR
jgi:hypothetical protein